MSWKIAIAGTGYIGQIHARAVLNTPGLELAAAVNPNSELLETFRAAFQVPRGYADLQSLLREGSIDGVVIATPNYLHAPLAIEALSAGVAVMVEKPMAMNAAEAERMAEASQKSGAPLMVAHCWRFDEEVRWLKQQADSGVLGRIVRTRGWGVHVHWGPSGWFTQKALAGGGALVDMGIHAIDTARFLLGDPQPVSVYARIGTHYTAGDVDDTGLVAIDWDNGATSVIESGWWQPHSDAPEAATQLYGAAGFGQIFPTRLELPNRAEQRIDTINPGFPFPRAEHCPQEMYDCQMAYFAACLQSGNQPSPGAAEGLVNMRILDAAYRSSETGEVVRLGT